MYDNNGQKQYEFSPWSNGLKDFKIQNRNRMCDSILVKFKVNNKRTKNQMIYKKKHLHFNIEMLGKINIFIHPLCTAVHRPGATLRLR